MKKILFSFLIAILLGVMAVSAGDQSCCQDSTTKGCNDTDCMDCVCDIDESCCYSEWNDNCIRIAYESCTHVCDCTRNGEEASPAPALSPTGLIALAGSLGLIAAVMIRRR